MNSLPKDSWKIPPLELAPHFMNIFYRVSSATAGLSTGGDKIYRYVEVFFWKFVDHFNSCFHLARRTPVLGRDQQFYDASSINVLLRAGWESYLTFNYIYVQSESVEEREFRFWGWWLAGLLDRQKAPTFDAPSILKMGLEKADITSTRLKLQTNPYFDKLSPKQQEALVNKGKWRLESWRNIAINAGFSEFLADQMYGFLSHYAHSGSASLLQIASEPSDAELEKMNAGMLRIPWTVAAHFLHDYCELINSPQVVLNEDEKVFLFPWIKLASVDPTKKSKGEGK